jgi:hypothetical protein
MRLFIAWALVLMSQAAAFAAAPPRLAVLGGEKAGLNDLLVARLSETDAVAIVERQELGTASWGPTFWCYWPGARTAFGWSYAIRTSA